MFKLIFNFLFIACFIGAIVSCNKVSNNEPLPEPVVESNLPKSQIEKDVEIKKSYCFRNEIPFKENSDDIDILELKLDIIGSSVTGIYNWLPKFKDRREGTISGLIENDIIHGKYEFTQEGKVAVIPIKIQLNENSVIIAEDSNSLGIGATIERTNCSL